MDDDQIVAMRYLKCPNCFFRWEEPNLNEMMVVVPDFEQKLCDFCSSHQLDENELLHRMIDIMQKTSLSDMPKVMKLLLKKVVLKDG